MLKAFQSRGEPGALAKESREVGRGWGRGWGGAGGANVLIGHPFLRATEQLMSEGCL